MTTTTRPRDTLPTSTRDGRRATCKLRSHTDLIAQMRFRDITTGYGLARAAGLKPGVVNHLVFGRRTTCSPETASAIERALGLRPGALFEITVYPVSGYAHTRKGQPR